MRRLMNSCSSGVSGKKTSYTMTGCFCLYLKSFQPMDTESMQCLLQMFLAWNQVTFASLLCGCCQEKKYHVSFQRVWRRPKRKEGRESWLTLGRKFNLSVSPLAVENRKSEPKWIESVKGAVESLETRPRARWKSGPRCHIFHFQLPRCKSRQC